MKFRAALLGVTLLMAACSSMPPVPIAVGDVCFRCRRVIGDAAMAAEIIDKEGRAYKFRTTGCMAKFIKANPNDIAEVYVTDYRTRKLVQANSAIFVPTVIVEGYNKTADYMAFRNEDAAQDAAKRENSTPTDWKSVLASATLE
jgi:copper chaperone NosL